MSEVEKATAEAVEAARQGEQYALMLAAITAAQQAQQPCHHPAPVPVTSSPNVGKWVALGAAGSMVGIAFALSAIAVAVGAVAVTCCLLILRSLWQDMQKEK